MPEKTEVITYTEKEPLFTSRHNPNHDIFVVPTLEGADKEDQWNGSIGDALMEHMHQMKHKRLELDHYFHMANGNIFRTEMDVGTPDPDGSRRIGRDMITVATSNSGLSIEQKTNLLDFFNEEIQENRKRIEEQQDALDQETVSFDQWETMPQSTKVDIPPAPKPIYVYSGNTSQMFYDDFPEDHPDAKNISSFLSMIYNIDIDDFEDNAESLILRIMNMEWEVNSTPMHLINFINRVRPEENYQNPDEAMVTCLRSIDEDWGRVVRKRAIRAFVSSQPTKDLVAFYKENEKFHERGDLIWSKLGELGKSFYKHGDSLTSAHWSAYFRMKKKLAPRLQLGNVDLNRAKFSDLKRFFHQHVNSSEKAYQLASKVYFNRPFMKLEDLVKKNLINPSWITGNEKNAVFVSYIKKQYQQSLKNNTTSYLSMLAQKIVEVQKTQPEKLPAEEWQLVWQVYRIFKEDLVIKLNHNQKS